MFWLETWSLTLREQHKFRALDNRALRKIFGLMIARVTGRWRKVHNEELHDLYLSTNYYSDNMRDY
jgi:hypothetical protein